MISLVDKTSIDHSILASLFSSFQHHSYLNLNSTQPFFSRLHVFDMSRRMSLYLWEEKEELNRKKNRFKRLKFYFSRSFCFIVSKVIFGKLFICISGLTSTSIGSDCSVYPTYFSKIEASILLFFFRFRI
jgi:hypothetical protein